MLAQIVVLFTLFWDFQLNALTKLFYCDHHFEAENCIHLNYWQLIGRKLAFSRTWLPVCLLGSLFAHLVRLPTDHAIITMFNLSTTSRLRSPLDTALLTPETNSWQRGCSQNRRRTCSVMRNRRADKNCEIALIVDAAYVSLQPSRLPFPFLGKSDLLVKTTCACTEVRRESARRHHLEFEIAGSRNSAKVNGRDCTVVGAQQLGSSFGEMTSL